MSRANEEEHRPSSPLRRAHVTRSERLNPEMAELHAGTGMMVLETDMPRRWAITILQLGHRRTVQRHLHTIAARLDLVRVPLADRSRGEAARRGQFVDGARHVQRVVEDRRGYVPVLSRVVDLKLLPAPRGRLPVVRGVGVS